MSFISHRRPSARICAPMGDPSGWPVGLGQNQLTSWGVLDLRGHRPGQGTPPVLNLAGRDKGGWPKGRDHERAPVCVRPISLSPDQANLLDSVCFPVVSAHNSKGLSSLSILRFNWLSGWPDKRTISILGFYNIGMSWKKLTSANLPFNCNFTFRCFLALLKKVPHHIRFLLKVWCYFLFLFITWTFRLFSGKIIFLR